MKKMKKRIALMLAACLMMCSTSGLVSENVSIVSAAEVLGSSVASTMMNTSLRDNTWLFTGGEAVQGGFEQTRGVRNYIGQFEEYVRWTAANSPVYGRQRFTFNTGKNGQTLAEIVEKFETKVANFQTKAVVYMIGTEDYSAGEDGLEAFENNLMEFIDKSLALKEGNGIVVIQKPFAVKDAEINELIEKYCGAVDRVVAEYADLEAYSRIQVVDHYGLTKNQTDFLENKLTDNKLNEKGHLEIAKQLAQAVANYNGTAFPNASVTLNREEVEQPEQYMDIIPKAVAEDDSLKVTIPEVEGVTSWKYILDIDGTFISGIAKQNTFSIDNLTAGKEYILKIRSEDESVQLVTTMGTIVSGNEASRYVQAADEKQQKILDMVGDTEKAMTWLFMGDSITHGSGLTYGYDGIAQSFEKFVKEELGRTDDVVLNTAVANADTKTTLEELDQRLTNYKPDVISIMIGTNDCSSRVPAITVEIFEDNLRTILNKMQEVNPDAVLIVRSMTPVFNDGNREPYMASYMEVVKELAEEFDTIYIDQYTALDEATKTYSWLAKKIFTDNLHPEANGHRIMLNMFLKACGLWTEDSPMTNLFYDMGIAEVESELMPSVLTGDGKICVEKASLKNQSNLAIGAYTVKATSLRNGQSYEVTAEGETAVIENLPYGYYDVEVSSYLTDLAQKVSFHKVRVSVSTQEARNLTLDLADTYTEQMEAAEISEYPDENVVSLTVLEKENEIVYELHDHAGAVAGSLDTFSASANENLTSANAEFIITATDETQGIYKVQHVSSGKYLVKTGAAYAGLAEQADTAANQLKLTAETGNDGTAFKICRASDSQRYIVFAFKNMTFDTMGQVITWNDGTYDLCLLEKQETVTESDVIPGYQRADKIISGRTYLIAYVFTEGDSEHAIVLYPQAENNASQTKLIGKQIESEGYEIKFTAKALGSTTAVINGDLYQIRVIDKNLPEEPLPEVTETPAPTVTPSKESVDEVFSDVYRDWYLSYVQYVYDHGLMSGMKGTDRFEPLGNITKAQVAQVLYNMEGQPAVENAKVFTELYDVFPSEWFADAVAWAYETGVVTGDLNAKKFFPNADVSREQLALMMYRYAQFCSYDTTVSDDLSGLLNADKVSNWAADGVKWAVGAGLISGIDTTEGKDLAPQGSAGRAQMAAILQRFCENVK